MARIFGQILIDFEDEGATREKLEKFEAAINAKMLDLEIMFDDLAAEAGIDTSDAMHSVILHELDLV